MDTTMASTDVDLDFDSPLSLVLIFIWRWQRVWVITLMFLYPLFEMFHPALWTGSLSILASLCHYGWFELFMIMFYDFNPINILMHEGLRIRLPISERKLTIIRQFAPNTCTAAATAWGGGGSVWPCQREMMVEWYAWLRTSDRNTWDLLKNQESRGPMLFMFYVILMVGLFLSAVYKTRAAQIKDQKGEQDREEEGLVEHAAAEEKLKD